MERGRQGPSYQRFRGGSQSGRRPRGMRQSREHVSSLDRQFDDWHLRHTASRWQPSPQQQQHYDMLSAVHYPHAPPMPASGMPDPAIVEQQSQTFYASNRSRRQQSRRGAARYSAPRARRGGGQSRRSGEIIENHPLYPISVNKSPKAQAKRRRAQDVIDDEEEAFEENTANYLPDIDSAKPTESATLEDLLARFIFVLRDVDRGNGSNAIAFNTAANAPRGLALSDEVTQTSGGGPNGVIVVVSLNGHELHRSSASTKKGAFRLARDAAVDLLRRQCTCIREQAMQTDDAHKIPMSDIVAGRWRQKLGFTPDYDGSDRCALPPDNIGRRLLEKSGWREGQRLGASDTSSFDARRVALTIPSMATQRHALGSIEGHFRQAVSDMLDHFTLRDDDMQPIAIEALLPEWRKTVHLQAMHRGLRHDSSKTSNCVDTEKTVFIRQKHSLADILRILKASPNGQMGPYSLQGAET